MAEIADERRRRGWFQPRVEDDETEATEARIEEVLGILATGVRRVLEKPPEKVERAPCRAAPE